MCSGLFVPGMTHVTAGWPRTNFSRICAQLVQPISPAHCGSGRDRTRRNNPPPLKRQIDQDRHAALRGEREDAIFRGAIFGGVIHLHEVELLIAHHRLEFGISARRVMGHAEIADAAFALKVAQCCEMDAPIEEIVDLHEVEFVGPETASSG